MDLIRDILHHEDYKNITGLAKVLNQFLEEQYDQMDMEGEHLDQEESEVAAAKAALNSHPCPCVWGEWSNWGLCSATCGGGVSTRNRGVEKEAVNGGDQCEGSTDDEEACHQEPCRKLTSTDISFAWYCYLNMIMIETILLSTP